MLCFFTSSEISDKVTQITIIAKTINIAKKHAVKQFEKYKYKGKPIQILAT